MLKENNIAIAILLVAVILLLFHQNSETMIKLCSIEQSTERLLTSVEPTHVPVPARVPMQQAQQRTPFQPIVYQWPGHPETQMTPVTLDLQDWSQAGDTDPAETAWGKETGRHLKELELEFKQASLMYTSHDQRLDSLESKIAQLELLCSTSKASASQRKTTSANFELLSVDDDSPSSVPTPAAPILIEQPQFVHYQPQPVYTSSPLTYGSTGSQRMAAAGPAYGFIGSNTQSYQPYAQSYAQSFGQSPQYTTTRVVRRPVQQIRSTTYGPVLGTRLGSRVGNFFGQDCPGGVCPQR